MKILIVDDSRAMRRIVVRTLRQAGYGDHTLLEAGDGAEGLVKVATEAPDLVLSDWNMPRIDGLEFLRTLRASGNDVRFGFVTSESTDAMRAVAEQAGALFLIGKPFTAETFVEQLEAVRV